jgi:hypothetical protein
MSNAWKYGDYDTAFQLIALAGQDPIVNTLEIVLVSADNYIEIRI